ncbi:Gluconate kinase [Aphelenchoides fujianensis]|nr:Gluconate kinase [Aphelenchoides fujianensis]
MYEELGYVIYRRIVDYYSGENGEDAYDMRKGVAPGCGAQPRMPDPQRPPAAQLKPPGDCFECKVSGTAAAFALGAYIWYNSRPGRYNGGARYGMFLKAVASGAFYVSAARWFYLPPFDKIER